jgi:hypothetical protein
MGPLERCAVNDEGGIPASSAIIPGTATRRLRHGSGFPAQLTHDELGLTALTRQKATTPLVEADRILPQAGQNILTHVLAVPLMPSETRRSPGTAT